MIEKKKRDEVWKKNKQYLDDKDTVEDIEPICSKLGCDKTIGDECRGCPVCELWLSNEYLEWCDSWEGMHDMNY
jgi:hypothetical protein